MNELFPTESVSQDSPRLKWLKEHGVSVGDNVFTPEHPDDFRFAYTKVASAGCTSGYGNTEDGAIVALAKKQGWRLWNED